LKQYVNIIPDEWPLKLLFYYVILKRILNVVYLRILYHEIIINNRLSIKFKLLLFNSGDGC